MIEAQRERSGIERGWECTGPFGLIHREHRQVSSLERTNVKNGMWSVRIAA
jgi:hypothetical protein